MVMDHNICATINGTCQIIEWEHGKPRWGIYKPGVYGDHNLIDRRGTESQFVNFDPAKFAFDVRLRAGASAIGARQSCRGAGNGHYRRCSLQSD